MMKPTRERKPAEESLFLRMLWFAMTFNCFYLVAIVDPNVAGVGIFDLKIPLMIIYFWVAVGGCSISYRYRHTQVKWLEICGLGCLALSCLWFADNLYRQFNAGLDIDLLLPILHLLTGMYVSHSFELRTRFDFNFSLVLSLMIACFAAALGKGGVFALGMFAYVVLAATLLLLDCEARTFGMVQARDFDDQSYLTMNRRGNSEKTANLIVPTLALLTLSICLFLVAPRAESLADQVSSRIYAMGKQYRLKHTPQKESFERRVRSPRELQQIEQLHPDYAVQKLKELPLAPPPPDRKKQAAERGSSEATKPESGNRHGHGSSPAPPSAASGQKSDSKPAAGKEGSPAQKKAATKPAASENKAKPPGNESQTGFAAPRAAAPKTAGPAEPSLPAAESKEKSPDNNVGSKSGAAGNAAPSTGGDSSGGDQASSDGPGKSRRKHKKSGAARKKTVRQKQSNVPESSSPEKAAAAQPKDSSTEEIRNMVSAAVKPRKFVSPDDLDTSTGASVEDTPIFQVACNRTLCFRQLAFDNFDGRCWHVSTDERSLDLVRGKEGKFQLEDFSSLALPKTVPAIRLTQKYHILNNLADRIVFTGIPTEIEFGGPSIKIDVCDNLKAGWALVEGLEYSVFSDDPMYDLPSMRQEGLPTETRESQLRSRFARFLEIPDSQSVQLYELARRLVGINDNWFVQAEKICAYLRNKYSYSNDRKYKCGQGNTADNFLFNSKAGDCKDFATSFVLLCRVNGIPARLVTGFSAGEFDPSTGTRLVRVRNCHAWGEIYSPSAGWVPFDPTPQGIMPARQKEEERYFTTIGKQVKDKLKNKQAGGSGQNQQKLSIPLPGGHTLTIWLDPWELLKLLPFLIAALVVSGPVFTLARRFARNIRFPGSVHPASKIYLQTIKDLKAFGVKRQDSQTPGEFLDSLREKLISWQDVARQQQLLQAVADLISCYNATYFGQRGSIKDLERKRQKIKTLLKR
jgi:hypothetical protein